MNVAEKKDISRIPPRPQGGRQHLIASCSPRPPHGHPTRDTVVAAASNNIAKGKCVCVCVCVRVCVCVWCTCTNRTLD